MHALLHRSCSSLLAPDQSGKGCECTAYEHHVSARPMSSVVGNDKSWLASIIAWLGLSDTACFQLVAGSSGRRCSRLFAACDSAVLSTSGMQLVACSSGRQRSCSFAH